MLFAAKPKNFFIESSDTSIRLARVNHASGSMVVEELAECPAGDEAAWAQFVQQFMPKKAAAGYLQAVCGVYPARRLVRRATIEPKRLREPTYLNEMVAAQCRIEPETHTLILLNADNGREYDFAKAAVKDVLICGLPTEEVIDVQDRLLEHRIYPERLEIGSVAVLGALADYQRMAGEKAPLLVLELGMQATQSFIVSSDGVEASRPIQHGLEDMVPVVQKELGLKDEESARKLFFSNTFDFTGLGGSLTKRLLKELQSSIGFHEVQTGQSIGHVLCLRLPPKLEWLGGTIASQLGVGVLRLDLAAWLQARGISVSDAVTAAGPIDARWFALFSLMANYDAVSPQEN